MRAISAAFKLVRSGGVFLGDAIAAASLRTRSNPACTVLRVRSRYAHPWCRAISEGRPVGFAVAEITSDRCLKPLRHPLLSIVGAVPVLNQTHQREHRK